MPNTARRVFVLVLDSLGVGALPDAADFGDVGAHTLDHLVQAAGGLDAPRLIELGLGNIAGVTSVASQEAPAGAFGRCLEVSPGKDTSTGHWEMMGCPLEAAFPVYPNGFPAEILEPFLAQTGLPGVLCNAPASGTAIIDEMAAEHIATGKVIVYTSADSVFQVAAHEEHFGLERLYEVCRIAREILRPYGLGRVIARPFVGEEGSYKRTYNRRDYSLEPPCDTALDLLTKAEVPVIGVGKISDIFAGRGVTQDIHTEGNDDGMRHTIELAKSTEGQFEHGFLFMNLVDFDMLYGHRRDPVGYRQAIETFDVQLVELETHLRPNDLVILCADHGNDPTHTQNTDHTREYTPIIVTGPGVHGGVDLGTRTSMADIGATVCDAFDIAMPGVGVSFLAESLTV
ncbi:MAG: phosphopentomutase [Glaciecola sp.]|jgi:phosphopentomutase